MKIYKQMSLKIDLRKYYVLRQISLHFSESRNASVELFSLKENQWKFEMAYICFRSGRKITVLKNDSKNVL